MPSDHPTSNRDLILQVAVPSPLRRLFEYLPPAGTTEPPMPGVRLEIPFGRRKVIGILVGVSEQASIDRKRLKPAIAILDEEPILPAALLEVLRWSANYYQHSLGEVFSAALPAKLRAGNSPFACVDSWRVIDNPTESGMLLKRAPRQQALLDFLISNEEATTDAVTAAGFNRPLLAQLEAKGIIVKQVRSLSPRPPFTPPTSNPENTLSLNANQQQAVAQIESKLDSFACFLLDGVTGSGKTEVYIRIMQQQVAKGRQCLVLVPEIGLTPQTISRFRERFDCPIVTLHSGLNDSERLDAWNQARDGSAGIIIGTRSAVFTPMARPGLIIIDEEHDSSFKQQDGFRYSARDFAIMRARQENMVTILGSATPSLESLHNCQNGKFHHLQLKERAGGAHPAAMQVIDIAETTLESGFSETSLLRIHEHIASGNQVLVFLNRRGFAPVLHCQTCGWVAECENCIAQLTVHLRPPGMRCHHCGALHQPITACPSCRSRDLVTMGVGTQKIEGFLQRRFPDTPVLRIDRDSTRSKSRFETILNQINEGDPCILLGTQMLAKGHHFPNITLVAIVDADTGLFSADFRGQEQMAQTIVQVAGRSGRANRRGEVLIQSRHAAHQTLQSLVNLPYEQFSRAMLQERREANMPPFSHLAMIRAESRDANAGLNFLQRVNQMANELNRKLRLDVELLGPLPAPMEKRAGRFRAQLLIKCQRRTVLQEALTPLVQQLEAMKLPSQLRWSLDVDPQELI